MKTVDEPESPNFSPDGQTIAFAALRGRHRRHLPGRPGDQADHQSHQRRIRRLRADLLARRQVHHLQRARQRQPEAVPPGSGHEEEDPAHLRHGRRDGGAIRRRPHRSCSRRRRPIPNLPLDPEVAKNGNIFNIWTLDLRNGELRQYTDALGGNWSAVVLNDGKMNRIAFVTYYKGEYQMHTLERTEPLHTASTSDFGAPGPIIDFQAPLQHTLVAVEDQEEGQIREDVPRRPAAGERRRHEQRRRLRRHADHVRRRARRSAVHVLGRLDRPVPHLRAHLRQPGAAIPVRPVRAIRRRSSSTDSWAACSTIRRSPRSSAAATRSRPGPFAAARRSASTRSAAIAASN